MDKWKQRLLVKANRLWRWFWFGLKKSVWTGHETFVILGLIDFVALVVTWCFTRPLALGLIGFETLRHGDFPPIWKPHGTARGIVLTIPGYTYTRRQLMALAQLLHRHNFVVARAEMPPNGNVLNYADTVTLNTALLDRLVELAQSLNLSVTIVGHSYGGCCGIRMAEYLRAHGLQPRLVVCVQTPVRGTRLAHFGEYAAAPQLAYEQGEIARTIELVEELESGGTEFVYYCALFDEVTRRRDSRPPLNGDRRRWAITLPQLGHWGAFQNPWALKEIVGFITNLTNGVNHTHNNDT